MTTIKLRKPRITEEQKKAITADYKKGLQLEEIIKKHDVALTTVYRVIREQK